MFDQPIELPLLKKCIAQVGIVTRTNWDDQCRGSIQSLWVAECRFHVGFMWIPTNVELTRGNSWEETNHLFFWNRELYMVVACSISPEKWLQREKVSDQEALTCSTNVSHGWSLPPPSARDKAVAGSDCSIGAQPKSEDDFVWRLRPNHGLLRRQMSSIHTSESCASVFPTSSGFRFVASSNTTHTRLRWTSESTRSWYLTFSQSSYLMTSLVKCWWIVNFSHNHQLLSFKWNGGPHDSKDVL